MIDVPGAGDQQFVAAASSNRRTIPTTCATHGAKGFCNLRLTKVDGDIVLDPHIAGSCVIMLDEDGAVAMRDLLIEWLRPPLSTDLSSGL